MIQLQCMLVIRGELEINMATFLSEHLKPGFAQGCDNPLAV